MKPVDVLLLAYDLIEGALVAEDLDAAAAVIRQDLEVLSREDMLRVALALAVEGALVLTPKGDRARLLDRVQRRRLHAMVGGPS